jgi:hypothetical protein
MYLGVDWREQAIVLKTTLRGLFLPYHRQTGSFEAIAMTSAPSAGPMFRVADNAEIWWAICEARPYRDSFV